MKKLFVLVLAFAMVFSLTACNPTVQTGSQGSQTPVVGIVNLHPSESGYREANVKDMDEVFNEANGYVVKKANYNTLNEQLDAANQFISDGVDYLLLSAADASGWDGVLNAAKNAGVKVFLFDRMIDADQSLYEAAVISDMENQGKNAVAWLKAQNLPEYKFIHIQGSVGSAAQIGRTEPLQAEIDANANWSLVRRGTGGDTWSPDEAKRIVEAAIAAGEDFNIVYAENDGMAEGAMKALQEAGISHGVNGKVMIMGFDFNRFALRYVRDGDWNFNGQCSPFQAKVIDGFIKTLQSGGSLNLASKIVINDEIITDHATITDAFIAQYGLGD